MAKERDVAATVISQDGDRLEVEHRGVRLTVPMRGFPQGFAPRPGSRVILYEDDSEVVARPLVRAIHGHPSNERDVWLVERGPDEAPYQAIAVRRR